MKMTMFLLVCALSVLAFAAAEAGEGCGKTAGDKGTSGDHCKKLTAEQFAKKFIEKHDADGDGAISKEELPGKDEKFAKIDANSDGSITLEELKQAHTKWAERAAKGGKRKHHKKEKDSAE